MISRFFIDRPIFASVLSIVITLAGGIALFNLPIAQYPQIAPPTVSVTATYPGANALVVSETVATPIEQQVNGVDNMMYMSSQCTNDGSYNLTVTFRHGIDLNLAQVLVQNRVSLALPQLPDVLKQTGVDVRKQSPDILMAVALTSPDNSRDQLYLSNYALIQLKDELARLPGVSEVRMLGQRDYSMRVWIDPDRLAARNMQAGDVVRALREQNLQVATGQIGQQPVPKGQELQVPLSTLGRLTEPEQYERIIVKTGQDNRVVRLRDVARVEMGAKNQDISSRVNTRPAMSLAIFQLPDANALDTADIIKAKMEEMKKEFPPGVDYEVRYDTTPFIRESIGEVFKTLREAILLVAVVVLLFLQNWRSAVIPLIAVPVAIIGTFAAMAAFGFSLNNLTLFGLVLAIGIVVDDAIVVVEAVEHHIEHGMSPRDATVKAMDEVSGPVIAIGLVLTAVFVPCAFITGIVGQFFRQFALTIAVSTVISAFNSLTLSPALAALLLKPKGHGGRAVLPRVAYSAGLGFAGYELLVARTEPLVIKALRWGHLTASADSRWWIAFSASVGAGAILGWVLGPILDRVLSGFFRLFNAAFKLATGGYTRAVGWLLRAAVLVLAGYGGLLYYTYYGLNHTATGFIPSQDMGYLLVNVQSPDATADEWNRKVMDKAEGIARTVPGVKHTQVIAGQSLLLSANGSNFGSMFVILEPFDERRESKWIERPVLKNGKPVLDKSGKKVTERVPFAQDSDTIAKELTARFAAQVPEAMFAVLGPPPVRGVGRAGGFKLMIERRGDVSASDLKAKKGGGPPPPAKPVPRRPGDQFDAPQQPTMERLTQAQAENLVLQQETENLVDQARNVPDPRIDVRGKTPEEVAALAKSNPAIVGLASVFRANVPQLFVDVNRAACMTKKVLLRDLFDTLRINLGSLYVNDFNRFGRTWQVIVQAEQSYRNTIESVQRLKVRNSDGNMVPVGAVAKVEEVNGPLVLTRYNMYPAAPINGAAAPGVSSGQAIATMERLAEDPDRGLNPSMAYEWTELAYLELQAGNMAMKIFGLAVVMVFLVLAAQYESWGLPLAIILVVPMCLLSAVMGVWVAKQDINIFTQIGFVVLVGLASKNAILIVEFAKQRRDAGESPRQAALDACTLRLRPIIMTSFAFILGVLPLLLSKGAGAEMRRTLGTTVFSGMLGVTLFGIFLTPVFFFVIERLGETSLLRSRKVRLAARVALYAVTLGVAP